MAKVTPMKAIRLKCLQCTCGQFQEIRDCTIKDCALYPYRMGHRPKKETSQDATCEESKNEAMNELQIDYNTRKEN